MRVSSAPSSEPQFTPMRTGLPILDRGFNHGAEVVVVLLADVDVAGIDPVLGQAPRACRILLQQQMAVVVEVADDGHVNAVHVQRVDNFGNCRRRGFGVDGDTHQLGASLRQRHDLIHRSGHIRRIGVGHGLHDNGIVAAHLHATNIDRHRLPAHNSSHRSSAPRLIGNYILTAEGV